MNTQAIINPSNGKTIANIGLAEQRDIELALSSARQAFDQGPWPKFSLSKRKEFLLKISQGILEKAGELAQIESQNTGKPIKETTFMDVPSAAAVFKDLADNLEEYLNPQMRQVANETSQAEVKLLREPLGVVLLIVPWNYPLLIASWKLAQALAAGNTVILKPSSLTPLSAIELAKIMQEAGLPKDAVRVVNAPGEEVGQILCSDPRIDMISFTGSNAVGKQIIAYSAKHVKKLIMELGGKSASIIFRDVDLSSAVNSALASIFLNQGQMCTAMSRILVEETLYEKFMAEFVKKTKSIKLGDALDYQTQMGPLISEAQRKKVLSWVEKARQEGAEVLCGGRIPDNPQLKNGFFFEPTVLTEVKPEASIFQEEVFGPVAVISKFSRPEEAIELANKTDFGLAASIWTKDTDLAEQVAKKLDAGIVWVNTYGMFYAEVPYGGFKQSGFGKELGREGFLEYTRLKNTVIDKTKDAKPLVSYWYGF